MKALENVPFNLRTRIAELAVEVISRASAIGDDRWGVTAYSAGFRLNVGWTEILTVQQNQVRLVVGRSVAETELPPIVTLTDGDDERGFYPSIKGSLLAELPYEPMSEFYAGIELLRPAIMEAVDLAARRRVGRGVRAGHSQKLVRELEIVVGRSLPQLTYSNDFSCESSSSTAYWVVRGSPAQNGDFNFVHAGSLGEWRTKKPPRLWQSGDRLFFWATSPRSELIALGEFEGETGEYTEDGETIYEVRYVSGILDHPLEQAALRADAIVRNAIFLKRGPAASVLRLSEDEGKHLYRLILSSNASAAGIWPSLELEETSLSDVDESAMEGDSRLVTHLRRERNRALVETKKRQVLEAAGHLACEVCGFDFKVGYGDLGEGFCEVHHRQPLASRDEPSITRLEDLAILCSNCHRIVHRANCEVSLAELRERITGVWSVV